MSDYKTIKPGKGNGLIIDQTGARVGVAYAAQPIGGKIYRSAIPQELNLTLADIVASVPNISPEFFQHGVVCINDMVVPREHWRSVRPKAVTKNGTPVVVTMHLAPKGGGKGGSTLKNVLTIVAAIAIVVATAFIGAGGLSVLLPTVFSAATFGAGTIGAAIAAAAVATIGSLLLNSLSPPPASPDSAFGGERPSSDAFADGNSVAPGGIIPRVIGTFRVFPPFLAAPIVDIVEGVEQVEAIYGLTGPHTMSDIQIDGIALNTQAEIVTELMQGFPTDPAPSLITRYGHTVNPQLELSQHILKLDDKSTLLHYNTTPEQDIPQWHTFITRLDPDEVWLQLIWPQGIIDAETPTIDMNIPYRMRMRPVGTTAWINLPEFHMHGKKAELYRKYIKLIWSSTIPDVPSTEVSSTHTFFRAFRGYPSATFSLPAPMGGWLADSFFIFGPNPQDVQNCRLHADGIKFFLYTSLFPRGTKWEIGIIRGAAFEQARFDPATYLYNSPFEDPNDEIYDWFGYWRDGANARLPHPMNGVNDKCILLRQTSVWNKPPVAVEGSGLAILSLRARSRQLNKVSVLASGLVPDWNGSIWTGFSETSNPAPHFRDVLTGKLNTDPLPPSLIDDAGLVAWRTWCDLQGHEINAIVEGRSVYETLQLIASCGRARPLSSDIWGVIIDRARISEAPVTIFTPRNSNSFTFEKILPVRSDAFRVKFRDIDNDYEAGEVIVFDPDVPEGAAQRFEEVSYEGLVYEDAVTSRMLFDILQSKLRSTTYTLDTDIESLVCRRGDIVGISHEVVQSRAGYGRINAINTSGGNVDSILLDNEVHLPTATSFFALTNVFTEPNIFDTGLPMGAAIRLSDGTIITKMLDATISGDTALLEFMTPFVIPAALELDCLVAVGPSSAEYGRYIVTDITPSGDLTAKLTLIDEATGLHVGEIGLPWDDGLFWDDLYGWSDL